MKPRHYLYITLGFFAGFMAGQALAAEAELPITARIIQCGTPEQAKLRCKYTNDRCCAVAPVYEIEPAAGEDDTDGVYVEPEDTGEGELINFE